MIIAFFLTGVMASMPFGISTTDPLTFLSVSFVLLAVALLARPARDTPRPDDRIAGPTH